LHAQLGDHAQAITACQQSLDLHQELGDHYGVAIAWDSLGYAHHHLGHHTRAIDCYHRALGLYRGVGDRYFEADTLSHLGDAYHAAGQPDAARDAWCHALAIFDELNHPDAEQVRVKVRHLAAGPSTERGTCRSRPN